jgi:sugar phosphate isomerase/epimerase
VGTDRKLAKFTETGTGVNDFCAIRQSAEKAGVKWASVEQDRPRELPPLESIRVSIEHLRKAGW